MLGVCKVQAFIRVYLCSSVEWLNGLFNARSVSDWV